MAIKNTVMTPPVVKGMAPYVEMFGREIDLLSVVISGAEEWLKDEGYENATPIVNSLMLVYETMTNTLQEAERACGGNIR